MVPNRIPICNIGYGVTLFASKQCPFNLVYTYCSLHVLPITYFLAFQLMKANVIHLGVSRQCLSPESGTSRQRNKSRSKRHENLMIFQITFYEKSMAYLLYLIMLPTVSPVNDSC